jgi:hypothetical protein
MEKRRRDFGAWALGARGGGSAGAGSSPRALEPGHEPA